MLDAGFVGRLQLVNQGITPQMILAGLALDGMFCRLKTKKHTLSQVSNLLDVVIDIRDEEQKLWFFNH
jgi:hypothetical protein